MSELLKALSKKQSVTKTENGAKTFNTSLNACLDLFFMGGAFRKRSEQEIISLFSKAYYENSVLALQILAYIRDCRGGMGERRFFRTCIKHLANSGKSFNLTLIPLLGRWDDVLELIETPLKKDVAELITLSLDNQDALCAKWMPRQGKIANYLRSKLDDRVVTPKEWRQLLVNLTKVVETQMCNREWLGINYSHVPSVANVKYNKAFLRNDETRRRNFLAAAVKGDVKINSSVAFPNTIVKMMLPYNSISNVKKNDTAIAMWNQLPDYLENNEIRMIPVCDTSGSMNGDPLLISVSLGLYISERNKGIFKDAFITFDNTPVLQYTKGNLYERLTQMKQINPSNTNLEATFKLILDMGIKNRLPEKEMPTHIIIISDMEFDQACRKPDATLYKSIKARYKDSGYNMPNIIFWNVNSKQNNVPIRFNQDGVGLVSGASPAVLQAVLSGNINPIDIMMRAVDQDKYKLFAE